MDKLKEWCRGLGMSTVDIDRIIGSAEFDCGRLQRHIEDGEAVYWATGICALGAMLGYQSVRALAGLYSEATGIEISPEELKKAGERIWNLCKLLNVREGFSRDDDKWPGLWVKLKSLSRISFWVTYS
jgi:aldehyde:ferredoxin oxidoreductase